MEDSVVQALFNCTQADASIRTSAESFLETVKIEPGFAVLLLQISHNDKYSLAVRQLASIFLKNQLKKWKDCQFSQNDKEFLKNNIIHCLKLSVPEAIRSQFEEIAYTIGRYEKSLENIFIQVHSYLDSGDSDMVYAGLSIIHQFSKQYEYVITEKRNNLVVLMNTFLPKLEILLEKLLKEQTQFSSTSA